MYVYKWHIVLKDDGVVIVNGRRCVNILNICTKRRKFRVQCDIATSSYMYIVYALRSRLSMSPPHIREERSSHHAVDICLAHANTACVIIYIARGMKTAGVAPLLGRQQQYTKTIYFLYTNIYMCVECCIYIRTCKRAVYIGHSGWYVMYIYVYNSYIYFHMTSTANGQMFA